MVTQKHLKSVLHYEPDSGVFTWLVSPANCVKLGDEAGNLDSAGYGQIRIDGKRYLSHRLAFLYMGGAFPVKEVDHINRIKHDNRWCNLRPATRSQNLANVGSCKRNTSGYKGVDWNKSCGKWRAQISVDGNKEHLGYFDCKHEAYAAYVFKSRDVFGEFSPC